MVFPELICILITMLCADAALWIIAMPRLRPPPAGTLWRALFGGFIIAQMLYLLTALIIPKAVRGAASGVPVWVHTQSYIWHMIVLPAVMFLIAAGWLFSKIRRRRTALLPSNNIGHARPVENAPTRRQVLAAAALAAPPIISTVVGVRTVSQLREMRVRRFDLRIPSLPPQLDGMTVTQVSDLHLGRFMRPDRLPDIIEQANAMQSDFVVFTGDLIDLTLDDLPPGLDFLHKLKARAGMAICEGNHDLIDNRGEFERQLASDDLPLLLGSTRTFSFRGRRVQFLGTPWNTSDNGHAAAVVALKPALDPDAFPILLAHHPHAFDAAAGAQFPLTLSGHTHGGQIMLNERLGAGPVRFRYISGLYKKGNSSLLVCNGIGNWFPLRINAPAEMLHIQLRSA